MLRTASPSDLPGLRELFADGNDAPYDLAAVAEEKCFGTGIAGATTVRVIERGRIVAAAVRCGKWLRVLVVAREARRQGLGTELVRDAESHGVTIIAAEPGNYFTPGVVESDGGSRAFFQARGYGEKSWTYNLDVALSGGGQAILPIRSSRAPTEENGTGKMACPPPRRATHDEADRVLDFIEREFGRIWRFEAAKAFERELPVAFISEEDGAIIGFAVHDVNNRGLGFFGPTGVARMMRSRGIGGQLLVASLADLHRLGYPRAVIPWTDALDFYRKVCGAEAAHRFVAIAKDRPGAKPQTPNA